MLIIQNRKMYVGSSVSSTPVMAEPATATFWPFHDGISGTSSATMSWSCPMILVASGGVGLAELLVEEQLTCVVGVVVGEEPTVTDERRQVVVGVQEVGVPAEEEQVVGALLVERLVLLPLGVVGRGLEQAAVVQLVGQLVRLVDGVGAVVRRRCSRA